MILYSENIIVILPIFHGSGPVSPWFIKIEMFALKFIYTTFKDAQNAINRKSISSLDMEL